MRDNQHSRKTVGLGSGAFGATGRVREPGALTRMMRATTVEITRGFLTTKAALAVRPIPLCVVAPRLARKLREISAGTPGAVDLESVEEARFAKAAILGTISYLKERFEESGVVSDFLNQLADEGAKAEDAPALTASLASSFEASGLPPLSLSQVIMAARATAAILRRLPEMHLE